MTISDKILWWDDCIDNAKSRAHPEILDEIEWLMTGMTDNKKLSEAERGEWLF